MRFNQYRVVIDERGVAHELASGELHRRLGTSIKPAHLVRYGATQMGWIGLKRTSREVEAVYDPERVAQLGVIRLMDIVWGCSVVRLNETSRGSALLLCGREAISHLGGIHQQRRPMGRFWRCEVPLDRSPFATRMPVALEILMAEMEASLRTRLLDSLLEGRFSINALDRETGHFKPVEIGDCIAGYDREFAASRLGDTYHTFVDADYGPWMANCFKEMAGSQHAKSEAINVEMFTPPAVGRISYTRLLMPFERSGEKLLLVASNMPESRS